MTVTAQAKPPHATAELVPPSLLPWRDPHPRGGMLSALLITLVAGILRVWNVGHPRGKVFDEIYYATEGQEIWRFGYEDNRGYLFVVHPPLGKWFIGASSAFARLFGWSDEVGWRLASGVAGTVTVFVVIRVARRMFRSNFFGAVAGVLLCCEGMSVVLSRVALLDIFLQPFVLGAFGALVIDRDRMRARLALLLAGGVSLRDGVPALGPRPWRLVAGVLIACACGVKWSALSFWVALIVLTLLWDRSALRAAGVGRSWRHAVRRSWIYATGSLLLAPLGVYILLWTGWIAGYSGWNRHWADTHSASATLHLLGFSLPLNWGWVPGALRSLGDYHYNAYQFHSTLYSPHPFSSKPWGWLVMGRPVDLYYVSSASSGGAGSCGASECVQELLLGGTPLIWWAFTPALAWTLWQWATTRDWRSGAFVLIFAAGWLVWFNDPQRTMFIFYMAPVIPFLVLMLTQTLGALLGPSVALRGLQGLSWPSFRLRVLEFGADHRRVWGTVGFCVFMAFALADFVWTWPLMRGSSMPMWEWQAHMWLPSWI